jgi:hypothetical protein
VSAAVLVGYRVRRAHALRALDSLERLRRLSRRDFQRALAASFTQQGFVVEAQAAAGGPITLVLRKSDHRILVECRHRTDAQVGVEAIERLHEAMTAEGATGGLVVTPTPLSPGARALAGDKPIGVIEGRAVLELLNRGRLPELNDPALTARAEPYLGLVLADGPDCPLCGSPMLREQAQESLTAAAWYCSQRNCGGGSTR